MDELDFFVSHERTVESDGFKLAAFSTFVEAEFEGEFSENRSQFFCGFSEMGVVETHEGGFDENGSDAFFLNEVENLVLRHLPERGKGNEPEPGTAIFDSLFLVVTVNGTGCNSFNLWIFKLYILEEEVKVLDLVPRCGFVGIGVDGDRRAIHGSADERDFHSLADGVDDLGACALVHVGVEFGALVRGEEIGEGNKVVALVNS